MKKKKASGAEQICNNCGHKDTGNYCSSCGQSFTEVSKPLRELLLDFLGAFNLDSSLFRTIGPFLFKPGFLTGEYLAGRRRRYMSPIRLYLVLSLVFFFMAREARENSTGQSDENKYSLGTDSTAVTIIGDSALLEYLNSDSLYYSAVSPGDSLDIDEYEKYERIRQSSLKVVNNKQLFFDDLFKYLSYSLFILMPVFALLLKLLYIRRKSFYVEHLLFSLNMHSFTLLVLSVFLFVRILLTDNDRWAFLVVLAIPVYFTAGMMRFYKQGFLKILLKEFILALTYTILLVFSLGGVAVLAFYLF